MVYAKKLAANQKRSASRNSLKYIKNEIWAGTHTINGKTQKLSKWQLTETLSTVERFELHFHVSYIQNL